MALLAITGATGFLGAHLCLRALAAGHAVRAVVRSPERARWLAERGVEVHRAELAEVGAMARAFRGADAVIANAARVTERGGTWADAVRDNVQGAENQLLAAAEAGVQRVVYVSTVAVLASGLRGAVPGDAPIRDPERWPTDLGAWASSPRYARSKALAERRLWARAPELGIHLTALRPGPIYGPGHTRLNATYRAWHRRRVVLAPTARFPHVHAADVADALLAAAGREVAIGRAYNLGGPTASPLEVLRALRVATGRGPVVIPLLLPIELAFDDRLAERELGLTLRRVQACAPELLVESP